MSKTNNTKQLEAKHYRDVTFKPEINEKSKKLVKRDSDVWSMLYKDAKERESRQKDRVQTEIMNVRRRSNSKHKSTERNNKKLIISKLNKNLTNAWIKNGVLVNRVINYQEMVKIIYSMGYILDNISEYEKLLVDIMFISIWNKDKVTIFIKNVFTFLLAVHGFTTSEKFSFSPSDYDSINQNNETGLKVIDGSGININYNPEATESKYQQYGYLDDKANLCFNSQDEIKELMNIYKVFCDNWKTNAPWAYYGVPNPDYERIKSETCSFKPKINESKSNKLILKQTEDELNKNLTHAEQLIRKGEKYKEKVQSLRINQYNNEIKGCTFIPVTNVKGNNKIKSRILDKCKN